ncbi:MAG: FecR family protein [Tannerellaceae bacterium]|nr:FecR family protein [Tannerellaceae bacterium]
MNNDLLQKYIEGNANQQEKEEIVQWLDASSQHMDEYLLMRNIYEVTLWNNTDKSTTAKSKSYNLVKKVAWELMKVAAVFLIAMGCSRFLFSTDNQNDTLSGFQTVYVPEGQRAELTLADGTKVWLNAKSSLTFPERFSNDKRYVELNGEAYFDVARDETKKFIVQTDGYHINVLGTEFNVNAYHNTGRFETSLIRGSVEVASELTNEKIILAPNTKVYASNNQLITANLLNLDEFLWKKGIMSFDNEQVKDIFKKLELYYDVKISVTNNEILEHPYTGKFWTKDGIEHVLKVLQLRHSFEYRKDNMNNILIY